MKQLGPDDYSKIDAIIEENKSIPIDEITSKYRILQDNPDVVFNTQCIEKYGLRPRQYYIGFDAYEGIKEIPPSSINLLFEKTISECVIIIGLFKTLDDKKCLFTAFALNDYITQDNSGCYEIPVLGIKGIDESHLKLNLPFLLSKIGLHLNEIDECKINENVQTEAKKIKKNPGRYELMPYNLVDCYIGMNRDNIARDVRYNKGGIIELFRRMIKHTSNSKNDDYFGQAVTIQNGSVVRSTQRYMRREFIEKSSTDKLAVGYFDTNGTFLGALDLSGHIRYDKTTKTTCIDYLEESPMTYNDSIEQYASILSAAYRQSYLGENCSSIDNGVVDPKKDIDVIEPPPEVLQIYELNDDDDKDGADRNNGRVKTTTVDDKRDTKLTLDVIKKAYDSLKDKLDRVSSMIKKEVEKPPHKMTEIYCCPLVPTEFETEGGTSNETSIVPNENKYAPTKPLTIAKKNTKIDIEALEGSHNLSIENGKKENGKKTSMGETAIYKKSGLEGLIDRFSKRLSEDDLNNLNDVLSLLNNDKGGIKSEDSLKKNLPQTNGDVYNMDIETVKREKILTPEVIREYRLDMYSNPNLCRYFARVGHACRRHIDENIRMIPEMVVTLSNIYDDPRSSWYSHSVCNIGFSSLATIRMGDTDGLKKIYGFLKMCYNKIIDVHGRDIILENRSDGLPFDYVINKIIESDDEITEIEEERLFHLLKELANNMQGIEEESNRNYYEDCRSKIAATYLRETQFRDYDYKSRDDKDLHKKKILFYFEMGLRYLIRAPMNVRYSPIFYLMNEWNSETIAYDDPLEIISMGDKELENILDLELRSNEDTVIEGLIACTLVSYWISFERYHMNECKDLQLINNYYKKYMDRGRRSDCISYGNGLYHKNYEKLLDEKITKYTNAADIVTRTEMMQTMLMDGIYGPDNYFMSIDRELKVLYEIYRLIIKDSGSSENNKLWLLQTYKISEAMGLIEEIDNHHSDRCKRNRLNRISEMELLKRRML